MSVNSIFFYASKLSQTCNTVFPNLQHLKIVLNIQVLGISWRKKLLRHMNNILGNVFPAH